MAAVLLVANNAVVFAGRPRADTAPAALADAAAAPQSPSARAVAGAVEPSAGRPARRRPGRDKVNATWAGDVDGGEATIAISVNDGVAIAYLCDGKRVEAWLQGTAADGKLT